MIVALARKLLIALWRSRDDRRDAARRRLASGVMSNSTEGEEQQDNHFGSPVLGAADDDPRWR